MRSGAALFGIGGLEKQFFDDDVACPRHQAEENEDKEYGRFSHIGPVDRYRCRLDDRDAGHLLLHFDFRIFELLRQLAVNAECQLLLVLQPVQFDLRRLACNVTVSVHGPGIVLLGFVVLLPRLVEQVLGKGQIALGLFGAVLGHVRFQLADHRVGWLSSYERILHRGRRGDDAGFLVYGDGYSMLQRVQDKALSAGQRIGIQRLGRTVVLRPGGENPADQTHRSPDDMTPPRRRQLLVHIVVQRNRRGHLFSPDRNLAHFVADQVPEKHFIYNEGFCPTHERMEADEVREAKEEHPDALVLSHPECNTEVLKLSDYIGSTSGIIKYATESPCNEFIICTEEGVHYKLVQNNPDKHFYYPKTVPVCPNMKKNTLEKVLHVLKTGKNEVHVSDSLRENSKKPLERMLELGK